MSQHLLLIAYDPTVWNDATPQQQESWEQAHYRFHEEVGAANLASEALQPPSTAVTVRHRGGESIVTSGPFAETTEIIGGFYLVEAPEADGPRAGLALLDGLDALLPGSHRVAAVRAELLRRSGDLAGARLAYDESIALCRNDAEAAHLLAQRDLCDAAPEVGGPLSG